MHIGNKEHLTPDLFVDNWEIKKVCETETGVNNLTDEYTGDVMIDSTDSDKYLGDKISKDGKNLKNILE